jgi:hypothetical protein
MSKPIEQEHFNAEIFNLGGIPCQPIALFASLEKVQFMCR